MKMILLLTSFYLSGSIVFADSGYSIKYSCDFIKSECKLDSKRNLMSCTHGEFPVKHIVDLNQSCVKQGETELTVNNLKEYTFKAWILMDKIKEFAKTKVDANQPQNVTEIRGLLDLATLAIAPIANSESVSKRFNNSSNNRRILVYDYLKLLGMYPEIGKDYLTRVYEIAMYDSSSEVQASAVEFLLVSDRNQKNLTQLLDIIQAPTHLSFEGNSNGKFSYAKQTTKDLRLCINNCRNFYAQWGYDNLFNSPDALFSQWPSDSEIWTR